MPRYKCDPEDKAEFIEEFAPKVKSALLGNKTIRQSGEELYQAEGAPGMSPGEWEVRHDKRMPKNRRYILSWNNSHLGYFTSLIQASRTIASISYDRVFD